MQYQPSVYVIDYLVIAAVEVHQEKLEFLLRLVKSLTVGTRVEGRVRRPVLGLEVLLEPPNVCDGIGPASSYSITRHVRRNAHEGCGPVAGASSGRHDCSGPRLYFYCR